ncbi:hypothetical protein L218DRAFT_799026, partial [Marasmius fiardii PR-910]
FHLQGASLPKVTQSLAYKAIRALKIKPAQVTRREQTERNLNKIKTDVENRFGYRPGDELIWKSLKHKDRSRKARYFTWMAYHDAYFTGT